MKTIIFVQKDALNLIYSLFHKRKKNCRSRIGTQRCSKTVVIYYYYQIKCGGEKCGRHFNRNLHSPQRAEEDDIDLTTNQSFITSLDNRFAIRDGKKKASVYTANLCHYS